MDNENKTGKRSMLGVPTHHVLLALTIAIGILIAAIGVLCLVAVKLWHDVKSLWKDQRHMAAITEAKLSITSEKLRECDEDRLKLWEQIAELSSRSG